MVLPTDVTRIYYLKKAFAQRNNLPVYFAAQVVTQTEKAVFLYGHGSVEAQTKFNACCICGATLSHPGSMMLGIGPVCLGNWGLRDIVKSKLDPVEIDILIGKAIVAKTVDSWVPKSCIKEVHETTEVVEVPLNHPKRNGNGRPAGAPTTRTAKQVAYKYTGLPAIKITFNEKASFYEDVARMKTLSGHRFVNDETGKYWVCHLSIETVERLKEWGFELDEKLTAFIKDAHLNVKDVKGIKVPGLQGELLPFQEEGVAFMNAKGGRALIGDEMGLGKTIQAIAYLQLHRELRPAVIVVPASLKCNWERELQKWMPDPNVQILSGTKPDGMLDGDIFIINYDVLPNWWPVLKAIEPTALVLDECHFIKNDKAQRTKAAKMLGKGIKSIIGLTGTPIENRPLEILNATQLINPTVFPSSWTFKMRYCDGKHNGWGWDFSGASNTQELHEILTNTIMLRRLKKDVLTELPDKRRSFVPVELDNWPEYNKASAHFTDWVREHKGDRAAVRASRAEQLSKIEVLKQLAVCGKMRSVIEWIHDFLESDGKLVVFAVHKDTINALMDEFESIAVRVDGSVPAQGGARQRSVDRFQTDDSCRLFVGNIKAAGLGLTLTAASNVAVIELPWTPGSLVQAEDRLHRIGQKFSVNAYYLLANGTIEERIAGLIDWKKKVLDSVHDGIEASEDFNLLDMLLDSYAA